MGMAKRIILILAAVTLMAGCDNDPDKGPDRYNCVYFYGVSTSSPTFYDRTEASNWCKAKMGDTVESGEECECGKNCRAGEDGRQVCKGTF